ncbi:MAG: membrane-bound serine racemase VanT [Lactobacillales bacterium]|jgi:serine/alanine racemase|nr:membrane-bound serine racemase VanT [Lactobacillales bacterium]
MYSNKNNEGIEQFRILAAIMIVAIHTFPFASLNPELDNLVTLTLFRVAVPFFLMVTGYFLLGSFACEPYYPKLWKIKQHLWKLLKIYGMAIIFYLPLSFYNGTLRLSSTFFQLVKRLFFDGTMYHLWYFPAAIIGLMLGVLMIRFLSLPKSFILSVFLYLIGVGGDSCYKVFGHLPGIKNFYKVGFKLFDYTRNGLFFAPIFLIFGAVIYQKRKKNQHIFLLTCSLVALLMESFLLHHFTRVRHDSMYLTLPIVMYFFFSFLLNWQPPFKFSQTKEKTLGIYLLHPLVIALIYFVGKVVPIFANSLLNFLFVLLGTILLTNFLLSLKRKFKPVIKTFLALRAVKIISTENLAKNVQAISSCISEKTEIMAILKANAYESEAVICGRKLEKLGVNFFAVATLQEAIDLRRAGVQGEILILGYTAQAQAKMLQKYHLIQAIISIKHAYELNQQQKNIRCHLKIDTGMHRLGLDSDVNLLKKIYQMKHLTCEGIFSHLGSADALDEQSVKRTKRQIQTFDTLLKDLKKLGIDYGVTHLQASYGILNYPELNYDYVRPGIILYGALSLPNDQTKLKIDLHPVVKIKAKLISIKNIIAGEFVGYGLDACLKQNTKVGIASIGYADGVPRALSNTGFKLFYKKAEIPQIGRVCMDLLLLDLSAVSDIQVGEMITVMTHSETVAEKSGTITNEILTGLGARLEIKQ